jgi:hypothetical protein
MIQSASSSTPAARAIAIAAGSTASAAQVKRPPIDQVHIDKAAALRTSLQQVPEIRPEVVERARALAADPAYPSAGIIRQISQAIVNSPDLSEDQS